VALNGVRVGYVKDMQLQGELKPGSAMDMLVKVTMEILPDSLALTVNGTKMSTEERLKFLSPKQYVAAGIRAKLGTESLVTGSCSWSSTFAGHSCGISRP